MIFDMASGAFGAAIFAIGQAATLAALNRRKPTAVQFADGRRIEGCGVSSDVSKLYRAFADEIANATIGTPINLPCEACRTSRQPFRGLRQKIARLLQVGGK